MMMAKAGIRGYFTHHKIVSRRCKRQIDSECYWASIGSPSKLKNIFICGANFPHLQPKAELRMNQRGEIGRQHVKAHSCSHFSPCFDHTSSTVTDDGTGQIDHEIGAYVPYSFRTMQRVLYVPFQLKYKDEGDKASGLTSPPNDAIIRNEKEVSQLAWSHQFFKDFGWWSGRGLNSRTPAQQTGALSTELTGRRETNDQLLSKIVQGRSIETTTTENVVAAQIANSLGSITLNISGGNCNITINKS